MCHQKKNIYQTAIDAHFGQKLYTESAKNEIVEFANSIDPDEAAHYELPHLDLHYLPFSL